MAEGEALELGEKLYANITSNANNIIKTDDYIEFVGIAIKSIEKQIHKKPIEKVMPYSEEVGFNSEWHCPCCDSYIGYFTEGMSEPEQMEYCNNCGQHIAKDWSDTD